MKRIRLFSMIFTLCLLMAGTSAWGQAIGDYGSNATNNAWNTAANWVVCVTSGTWDGATVATTAPVATTNVWIRSGHTITLPASGNCLCKDLNVESGGILASANINTSPRYIRVYGNTMNVAGQFGSASTDGLGVQLYGGTTQILTITGNGTIYINRVQPQTAGAVIFDANVMISYAGSGGSGSTGLYANNQDYTITINAGKTVTMANNSYIAVHGSSGGSAGSSNMTLNINGTLTASGSNSTINLNTAVGKTVNLNIGSAGKLNINGSLRAFYTNAGTVNVNISLGGQINSLAGSSLSLSKATVTNSGDIYCESANVDSLGTATINGGLHLSKSAYPIGTITLATGSSVEYYGTTPLTIPATPATYQALVINNPTGVSLSGPIAVNGWLMLLNGNLSLGDYDLSAGAPNAIVLGPIPAITGYVVTNGTGSLSKLVFPGMDGLFPVGTSTSYDPVTVDPFMPTLFSARVSSTLSGSPASGYQYNPKEWNLTSSNPSITTVKFTPSEVTATGPFNIIGHYEGGEYVNKLATFSGGSYTGSYGTFSPFVTGTSDTPTGLTNNSVQGCFVSLSGNNAIVNGTKTGDVLKVFNTSGQLVKSLNANEGTTSVKLNRGIYMIKLNNNLMKVVM